MSDALKKAQERLDLCQSRITRADDQGRRHTVKMIGDLNAARHAVEVAKEQDLTIMQYRVSTPNNLRDYPTFEEAKAAVLKGCPALKRGWTTEWVETDGAASVLTPKPTTQTFFRVLNSNGKFQTGACISFYAEGAPSEGVTDERYHR